MISLLGIIVFGVLFFGWFSNYKEAKNEEFSKKIYKFSQSDANSIDKEKFDVGVYVESVKNLFKDTDGFEGIFPLLLSSADKLFQKGNLKGSLELLLLGEENFASSNPYRAFFIRSRLAAVYEDLGNLAKSSEILKKLLKSPVKLMELKVYLDLGRLDLKQGNREKAKTTFQYVVDNGRTGDELTKVAKLYLSDLNFAK
ncbi:MAG: tetratricopeptide repeat protein [Bdellovibrionota bacterium]|nr:tetratricopeptide repeat protein [Bdellovibrionota bacterium]